MGAQQQVYCAVSGDFSGGPNAHDRGDTAGVARGALDAFWATATAGQKKAVIALGDLTGADSNSASYWRMKDIWGAESESVTCPGQGPATTVRGVNGRCYDHTGTGPHTGYMSQFIRSVTLPIPGNHDRDSPDNPGPYDGYWDFWREKNGELTPQLRPNNLGFSGDASGTDFRTGPFRYTADLPAADGHAYWRAMLIDVAPWVGDADSAQRAGILTWIQSELNTAAILGRHMIVGWHEPVWQIGGSNYGTNQVLGDIIEILQTYTAGFMVICVGHIHGYGRWNPMTFNGTNVDTSGNHGQTAKSVADYQGGLGGFVHIESGLGGQNPMWVPGPGTFATYWANIATQTTVVCRPDAPSNDGLNKAVVSWFNGAGAQEQPRVTSGGDPAAQTELDRTGQPGFPYGVSGFVLDQSSFQVSFWGNRAPYPNTPNVLVYDTSPTYTWTAAGPGPGPGPGPGTFGWRSAELYGGGGTQSISFSPLGTRAIMGGDNNGPKVTDDGGANWNPALGGYLDADAGTALQTITVEWGRDPTKPDRCWIGNKSFFGVSNNGGYDWTPIPQWNGQFNHGDPGNDRPRVVGHMIADDGAGQVYLLDNNGGVYRWKGFGSDGLFTTGATMTKIAALGSTGTGLCLDPADPTILFAATRSQGLFQLENIRNAGANLAVVRTFTGTGNPARVEEVKAVNEGTVASPIVKVYVSAYTTVKRVARAAPGGSLSINTTWDTITPLATSDQWAGIDAVRASGATLIAVGKSNDGVPSEAGGVWGQLWYTQNGHVASPTWTCLTLDNTNMDFVNQMGGASGKPWWGYGMRPGAAVREKAAQRWTEDNGNCESVAIDPVNTNLIIGVGQQGAWMYNTSTKRSYPSMVGIHTGVETQPYFDPTDANHVIITNSDHIHHLSTTGGRGGDWHKNEVGTPTSVPTGSGSSTTTAFFPAGVSGRRWWTGFGERFNNFGGDVFVNDDPNAGHAWVPVGLNLNGKRPMGLGIRRISGNDVVLIAVQNAGIYKRTFDTAYPPNPAGPWTQKEGVAFASMGAGPGNGWQRPFPIFWQSNTLAFAYDPSDGIWRSTNAGESWSRIWACPCVSDRFGYVCGDPDDPNAIYVSLGTSAATANTGVWRLNGANTGVVTNVPNPNPAGTDIQVTEIKKPNGSSFANPGTIACTTGGRVGVLEMASTPNPKAYLSADNGATLTDVTDTYFERSCRKVFGSAMGTDGRWIVAMNGPGMIVYDNELSAGGNGTTTEPPVTGNIVRTTRLQWAATDPTGTTFVSNSFPTGGPNRILVLDVYSSSAVGTSAVTPTSVAALGLVWEQRETRNVAATDLSERRLTTYTAVTDISATDSVTVTFPSAQTGCAVHVTEYDGVELGSGGTGGPPQTVSVAKLGDNAGDDANTTAYTVGPFSTTTGTVIGLVVGAVDNAAGGTPTITSVADGAGRVYTLQEDQAGTNTDEYKIAFYTAPTGTGTSTTITVTFDEALLGCDLVMLEFTNADTGTPVLQSFSDAAATGQPNISLTNAPAATSICLVAVGIRRNPPAYTGEAGWVEQFDAASATPANGLYVATRTADQTFTSTGAGGSHWRLIAEIQGAAGVSDDPVVQSAAADWGSTASKPTISLDSPPLASGANAVHTASVTPRVPATWDPELGWDEIWDGGFDTPATGTYVAGKLKSTDQTFTSPGGTNGRWAATILELRAAAEGGVVGGLTVDHDVDYIVGVFKETEHTSDMNLSTVSLRTLTSGFSDTDASVYSTASITPTSGRAVYAGFESAMSNGVTPPQPIASGAGLTWTALASRVYDSGIDLQRRRLTVFRGLGTPSSGAVTFTSGIGTNNDGTYEAAVVLNQATLVTNAPRFIQSLTSGMDVPGHTDFAQTGGGLTIEAWVRQVTTGGNQRILETADGSRLRWYTTGGEIRMGTSNGSGFQETFWNHAGLLNNGSPHHLVMRYDSTTDLLQIWVDGVQRVSTNIGGNVAMLGTDALRVGNKPASGATSDGFDGYIGDVAWYKTALSDARIAAHYAAAAGDYAGTVLADSPAAYWRMAETSGTIAYDEVGVETQTHGAWVLVESNGVSLLQPPVISTITDSQILSSVTPAKAPATFLSFVAKKGDSVLLPGQSSMQLAQAVNALPQSATMGMYTSVNGGATIGASSQDLRDMVMMSLELAPTVPLEVAHTVDFIVFGVPVVITGKKRARRRPLSRVYATIHGTQVPLQADYEFSETAMGGYDRAKLSVPAVYARAHPGLVDQDAVVTFWNAAGTELWKGVVQRPPEFREGLAMLECAGAQHEARGISDRLLYQAAGSEGWVSADADPHNFQVSKTYNVSVENGRLMLTRPKDEVYTDGTRSGWVFWAQGADINRVAFVIRKSINMQSYDLRVFQQDGPSNEPLIEVASWPLDSNNPDGTEKIKDQLGGNHDLIAVMVRANSSVNPSPTSEKVWLQDIRVNAIADNDTFTTTQVAKDIANRMGWDPSGASASDFNALPYDVDGDDWGTALDYVSLLDDFPWQVYGSNFRRRHWSAEEYFLSFEAGAVADLSPEPIYDEVSVVYEGLSGKLHTVTRKQGNGRVLPPVEMGDPQRNDDSAKQYAERLLAEFGVERYTGNISVFDGNREIHAGRHIVLTDWEPDNALGHRISDTSQTASEIKLGVRTPQIVSRWLARAALRSARRTSGRR